jgi:phosphate-selective porin OprO/OprP
MPNPFTLTRFAGRSGHAPVRNIGRFGLLTLIAMGVLLLAGGPGHAAETAEATVAEETRVAARATDSGAAAPAAATADAQAADAKATDEKDDDKKPVKAYYKKGLHISTDDEKFSATINWRAQLRLTDLSSSDLVGEEDGVEEETGFLIRRARFKIKGHAYRTWLKYYLEYGLAGNILLTFQFDVQPIEEAGLRVGQYKVLYNRERVDSSGKQQFVDRSIVNNPFTVDRQSGFTALGHLFKGTRGDSKYALGVFTGTGRGGPLDDDRRPMYVGRWQWNFLKRDLAFSQSDTKPHEKAAASFALAASSNVSRYTRFSSSGGGQLPGFDDGVSGQYKLQQWMAEYAHQFKGFSFQGEYHEKRVDDRVNNQITDLRGFYAQVGYFFHQAFPSFPRPLEFALRVAQVDSDGAVDFPADREATLGMNWFFSGHSNKLSADFSRLESSGEFGTEDDGWRARLQWDITF